MSSDCDVFQRVEEKYRVNARQRRAIERAISTRMAPDGYGVTRVTSLYLDTPDFRVIERSLEKPLYKEKLRVRAYGERAGLALVAGALADAEAGAERAAADAEAAGGEASSDAVRVFFELKKKYRGVVYKRRVPLSLAAARACVHGACYEDACAAFPLVDALEADASGELSNTVRHAQIAHEIEAARARWGTLAPSFAIACDRVAWAPRAGKGAEAGASALAGAAPGAAAPAAPDTPADLRITFDANLRFLNCVPARGRHAASSRWRALIDPADSILEVKCAGAQPLWLADVLAQVRAYPQPFSKCGAAYQTVLKEGVICA